MKGIMKTDSEVRKEEKEQTTAFLGLLSSVVSMLRPPPAALGHNNSTGDTTEFQLYPSPSLEPPIEDDGLPINPIWVIAQKETNAIKMKYWAEKRESWARLAMVLNQRYTMPSIPRKSLVNLKPLLKKQSIRV